MGRKKLAEGEGKDTKVAFRFNSNTAEKLKKMSEESGISQASILENLVSNDVIFTKNELKEMRFCVRSFLIDSQKAIENFPTMAGIMKQYALSLEIIVGKIETLQKYYK
jgi:hypothetical protein